MTASEHEHLTGYLDPAQPDDADRVARAERLRAAVAGQPVQGPEAGFFESALAVAAREGGRDPRHAARTRVGFGVGSAIAAGLAVWLVSAVLLKSPDVDRVEPLPGLTMVLNEARTVNLMFASADALDDATLVVQLPAGIEVEGYAGRREIRWSTRMQQGRNVLPLPLLAINGTGGELIARVEHDGKQKTFRLTISVT